MIKGVKINLAPISRIDLIGGEMGYGMEACAICTDFMW